MKSSFFLKQENVIVKHSESYNQEKDSKLTQFSFQTVYDMDINIYLQRWIILQIWIDNSIQL